MRPVPLGFVRRRSKAGPTHETASTSATDAAAPSWIQRSKQRAKPAPSVQPAPRMRLKATLGARHAQPGRSRIELVGCLPRRTLEKSQRTPALWPRSGRRASRLAPLLKAAASRAGRFNQESQSKAARRKHRRAVALKEARPFAKAR
jgi:hypothetical protein